MANISTSTNCNISFTDQEKGILQKASEICKNIGHELWHSGNTDEAEPVPDPPAAGEPARKSRGGGRKVSIDYGKIMALRDAKWSNKDIAEEMGMTPESVAVAVHNYRKKNAGAGGQEG